MIQECFWKKLGKKSNIYFNYTISMGVKDWWSKKLKRKSLKRSRNKKFFEIIKKLKKPIRTILYQWGTHEWWSQKLNYKNLKFNKKWEKNYEMNNFLITILYQWGYTGMMTGRYCLKKRKKLKNQKFKLIILYQWG